MNSSQSSKPCCPMNTTLEKTSMWLAIVTVITSPNPKAIFKIRRNISFKNLKDWKIISRMKLAKMIVLRMTKKKSLGNRLVPTPENTEKACLLRCWTSAIWKLSIKTTKNWCQTFRVLSTFLRTLSQGLLTQYLTASLTAPSTWFTCKKGPKRK